MISQPASPDDQPEGHGEDHARPLHAADDTFVDVPPPGELDADATSAADSSADTGWADASQAIATPSAEDGASEDRGEDELDAEELFSQDEIEQAYQRALAAFESAQDDVFNDADESTPEGVDEHVAGHAEVTDPDIVAEASPTAGAVSPPDEQPDDPDEPPGYDEIPVDFSAWTDDPAGDFSATGLVALGYETTDASVDPTLEDKAHAEFEAIQGTLPPETLAAWQSEVVAAEELPAPPPPPPPPSGRPSARPASRSTTPAASPPAAETEPNVTPTQVIEAALFVGGNPLTAGKLYALMRGAITVEQVPGLVDELNTLYAAQERPYEIRLGDGGYRLELRPEYDRLRARVFGQGPREVRLSQDVLEVLALVAYRQPITQAEIEALGKAGPGNVLRQLLRRELIQLERDPENPKDVRYRTTERFLSVFGLANLADLPQPDDLAAR